MYVNHIFCCSKSSGYYSLCSLCSSFSGCRAVPWTSQACPASDLSPDCLFSVKQASLRCTQLTSLVSACLWSHVTFFMKATHATQSEISVCPQYSKFLSSCFFFFTRVLKPPSSMFYFCLWRGTVAWALGPDRFGISLGFTTYFLCELG